MIQGRKIIGVDISGKSFDAAIEKDGAYIVTQYDNTTEGFSALLKVIAKDVKVVIEVSNPYYLRLAGYLYDRGIKISVVNSLNVRRHNQVLLQRTSTDKAYAIIIAQYGKEQSLQSWTPPRKYETALKRLEALLDQCMEQRTGLLNEQKIFVESGKMPAGTEQSLVQVNEQIADITAQMDVLMNDHYRDMNKRLQNIAAIDSKAANMLMAAEASAVLTSVNNYLPM